MPKCKRTGHVYRHTTRQDTVVSPAAAARLNRLRRRETLAKTATGVGCAGVVGAAITGLFVLGSEYTLLLSLFLALVTALAVFLGWRMISHRTCSNSSLHAAITKLLDEDLALPLSQYTERGEALIHAAETRSDFWPAAQAMIAVERLRGEQRELEKAATRVQELGQLEQADVTADVRAAEDQIATIEQSMLDQSAIADAYLSALQLVSGYDQQLVQDEEQDQAAADRASELARLRFDLHRPD